MCRPVVPQALHDEWVKRNDHPGEDPPRHESAAGIMFRWILVSLLSIDDPQIYL